jgi:hypothetical protein
VLLVHLPGASRAAIALGARSLSEGDPMQPALEVASHALAGVIGDLAAPWGALDAGLVQRTGPGVYRVLLETGVAEMADATRAVRGALAALGTTPLAGLASLRSELADSLGAELAEAWRQGMPVEDVANLVAAGRNPADLLSLPERIRRVTAEEVRSVARASMGAEAPVVVVAGDARRVLAPLEALGPVELVDRSGRPLDRAALVAEPASVLPPPDPARLEPGIRRYEIRVEGRTMANVAQRLERSDDSWIASTFVYAGVPGPNATELRFDARDFTPLSLRIDPSVGAPGVGARIEVAEGHLRGTVTLPPALGGARRLDVPVGTLLLPGMEEHVLAALVLAPGVRLQLEFLDLAAGVPVTLEARVSGPEWIEVPAGRFETFRVEVVGPDESFFLFLRAAPPHILLEQRFSGTPARALVLVGRSPLE